MKFKIIQLLNYFIINLIIIYFNKLHKNDYSRLFIVIFFKYYYLSIDQKYKYKYE